jgi:5'-3' exonuclease
MADEQRGRPMVRRRDRGYRCGMKVHLIDGTYELFRMFFGAPSSKNADGEEIGATRALLGNLLTLVRDEGASHVAVAFDTQIESFRNDLFDGYKTGEGIEPELFSQFPLAEEAVRALGMVCWSMIEFEADDALATAAHLFKKRKSVEQVLVCTPDKDLAQCVEDGRVVQWDRRKDIVLDEAAVIAKHGVRPELIPDYLALVGDTADGIPGLPGWGAKSSATALMHFGSLDAIPDDAEAWDVKVRGAAKLAATLAGRREDAALYRELATLRTDVPLTEKPNDLAWKGAYKAPLERVCERLNASRLLDRVPRWRAEG